MSYIGKKPSFSQMRTTELVIKRSADIVTAGTISALDVSNVSFVRLTAATTLQGIVAPVAPVNNGKRITLINANSVSLTVSNESSFATTINRISTSIGRDLVITAGASVTLLYNTASLRWSIESYSGNININRLQVATEAIAINSTDLTPTIFPESGLIELTAGSQTTIRSISTGTNGQFLTIINKTGLLLQVLNEDLGAANSNRILTGTGASISLQNNSSLFLAYLGSVSRWQIIGGAASSSSNILITVTQNLHGFTVADIGKPVYLNSSVYAFAQADIETKAEVAGIINSIINSNSFELCLAGEVTSVSSNITTINRTTANGLGSNAVRGIFVTGSTVYAATPNGLSISTDGGATFVNRTTANGLGNNSIYDVFVTGSAVYAATNNGLSISTDGGATFVNRTTANGLGNNNIFNVFVAGSTVYAATENGLSISTDGGATFVNRTTANGLGNNNIFEVFADGSTVYAATSNGLSISTDGGATFVNRTTANGLGGNGVLGIFVTGSAVYAATLNGLSISTDGGATFVNRTTANGLGNNSIYDVFVTGSTVYAATSNGGLSISTDGGATFVNRTTANGLGNNSIYDVFVTGSTVYAATFGGLSYSSTVDNFSLVAGKVYFLSAIAAGKLTSIPPSVVGQISKPVGIARTISAIDFFNMRGSVVGGANLRTQINLANNATTTIQNAGLYDAGELAGWVYIDATTDSRFYVQAQFAKNGAGTNYNLAFQTTGDTPPAGFSVSITTAGLIQVTLPSVAGFVSASINFALNAPAVGATLPLQISGGNVTGPVLGSTSGASPAAGYVGEVISLGSANLFRQSNPVLNTDYPVTGLGGTISTPGIYMIVVSGFGEATLTSGAQAPLVTCSFTNSPTINGITTQRFSISNFATYEYHSPISFTLIVRVTSSTTLSVVVKHDAWKSASPGTPSLIGFSGSNAYAVRIA